MDAVWQTSISAQVSTFYPSCYKQIFMSFIILLSYFVEPTCTMSQTSIYKLIANRALKIPGGMSEELSV